MSDNPEKITETRGRPKKADHQNPEKNYYEMFSVHAECIYLLILMYVLQVFHSVKVEKRIGHSYAGFTIYKKNDSEYSFDSYQKDLKELGAEKILEHNQLAIFSKRLVAIGPTCVFKQIMLILKSFLNYQKKYSPQNALTRIRYDLICQREKKIDELCPYLRFKAEKLEETKETDKAQVIYSNVKKLWPIFVWIMTYSMFSCFMKTTSNKYLRALSTDAPQSMKSLIGHPDLEQVILLVTPQFNKKLQRLRIKGYKMITKETGDKSIYQQNERLDCESKKQSDEDISVNSQNEFGQRQFHQFQKAQIQPKKQIKTQIIQNPTKKNQKQRPKLSFHLYNQTGNNEPTEAQKLIIASEKHCFQNNSLKPQQLEQYGSNPKKRVKISQNFQQFSSKETIKKSKLNNKKSVLKNKEEQLCEQQSQEN